MKSKSQRLSRNLAERIRRGDYDLRGMPGGSALARSFGISRNTAYKILDSLAEEGLLVRQPNGRLVVRRQSPNEGIPRRMAFLQPSFTSDHFDMVTGIWRRGLDKAALGRPVQIRPLVYTDYGDPVIREAVQAFEGVFFFAMPSPVPEHLLDAFRTRAPHLVALGCDLSSHGIRSVRLCSAASLQRLLNHLAALGHRHIDCLNVHPTANSDVAERIRAWEVWRNAHMLAGRLINAPVEAPGVPFDHAFQQAHEAMRINLAAGEFRATALFCVSMPAALGAMRALAESGYEVGQDVSVCAAIDEGMCRYLSPSLTAVGLPDPAPYLELCLEKIMLPQKEWDGPLLLQPDEAELFLGDSTGPCAKANSNAPQRHPNPGKPKDWVTAGTHSSS